MNRVRAILLLGVALVEVAGSACLYAFDDSRANAQILEKDAEFVVEVATLLPKDRQLHVDIVTKKMIIVFVSENNSDANRGPVPGQETVDAPNEATGKVEEDNSARDEDDPEQAGDSAAHGDRKYFELTIAFALAALICVVVLARGWAQRRTRNSPDSLAKQPAPTNALRFGDLSAVPDSQLERICRELAQSGDIDAENAASILSLVKQIESLRSRIRSNREQLARGGHGVHTAEFRLHIEADQQELQNLLQELRQLIGDRMQVSAGE